MSVNDLFSLQQFVHCVHSMLVRVYSAQPLHIQRESRCLLFHYNITIFSHCLLNHSNLVFQLQSTNCVTRTTALSSPFQFSTTRQDNHTKIFYKADLTVYSLGSRGQTFFKGHFFNVHVCMPGFLYVHHMHTGACRGLKGLSDPLGLE